MPPGGAPGGRALRAADSPGRVRCRTRPPQSEKSPLEKGAVSEADWGFLPQMQHRGEKPPGIAFGHASPLFKGGYLYPPTSQFWYRGFHPL